MPKVNINLKELDWRKVAIAVGSLVLALVAGGAWGIAVKSGDEGVEVEIESEYSIELSEEQVPAVIELDGETEVVDVPTVELIDDGEAPVEGEDAQGAWHDTSSPEAYKNSTLNQCIENAYGGQCFALANDFWQNYSGRSLSSCGTGAAKGTWNCKEQNAGEDFVLIYNAAELQAGDWVVYSNGTYGHIGMALGPQTNGYVALLGENQGGPRCSKGGGATNIINKSNRDFVGAFRPKAYIKAEPTPNPDPTPIPVSECVKWHVLKGDTMSKIMLECENTVVYGPAMDAYAKTWFSLIYKPGQSVYDGWHSSTGVGLYAGDDIEHRIGQ